MEVRVFSTAPSFSGIFRRGLGRAALLAVLLYGTAANAATLGGRYRVEGTNPSGSHYGGTATITPSSDTTCRISWQTGSTSTGICMVVGDTVAASYALGNIVGLVLYQMQPDGSLKGVWTVADKPGSGTEILTPIH